MSGDTPTAPVKVDLDHYRAGATLTWLSTAQSSLRLALSSVRGMDDMGDAEAVIHAALAEVDEAASVLEAREAATAPAPDAGERGES